MFIDYNNRNYHSLSFIIDYSYGGYIQGISAAFPVILSIENRYIKVLPENRFFSVSLSVVITVIREDRFNIINKQQRFIDVTGRGYE